MGKVTAKALAAKGYRLILVDWQGEEGARTRDEINAAYPDGLSATAEFRFCDLSDLAQLSALAKALRQDYPALDVLVNNAGITYPTHRVSPQGFEFHLAICHLAHFCLSLNLLPMLEAAEAGRIVVVSSEAHKSVDDLDLDDLNGERYWRGRKGQALALSHTAAFRCYAQAKLCNVLFMRGLHQRLRQADSTVSVNAVSPGYFVNTGIHREMRGIFKLGSVPIFWLGSLLGLNTAEKGARSHIYCASEPVMAGISGEYYQHCKAQRMDERADDQALIDNLWQRSEAMVGPYLIDPNSV